MPTIKRIVACAILALTIGALTSPAIAQLTPPYDWKVMETPHFRIIFHPEVAGLAQEAAVAAEETYQKWSQALSATPPGKTSIVVIDFTDSFNGFADTFNQISWEYATPVQISSALSGRAPSNMDRLITHEYWHIMDIDKVSGISQALRAIFGRIILPGDIKPQFNVEGSAVYAEYQKFGYSRANWAQSAAYLRQMILDNDLPPLDRAAVRYNNMGWPGSGTDWYLLGSWFMRYLDKTYGPGLMAKIDEINGQNWLAALSDLLESLIADRYGIGIYLGPDFSAVFQRATGKPLDELYSGFKAWLREQFEPQLEKIAKAGITPSRRLTHLGQISDNLAWSPDGQWIAYRHADPFRRSGLRAVQPSGEGDHAVKNAVLALDGSLSWSPDGSKLIYSQYDRFGPYFEYNDLYLYDLKSHKEERLTWGQRAYNPAFTPDGRFVLFAQAGQGDQTPSIAKLDPATGKITTIQKFDANTVVDTFALAPDGSQLALSIWKRPGYLDIYTLPAGGGQLNSITQDQNEDFRPSWSPDGQYVLFDSIRDDVFNLYAYRLADGQFSRITNTLALAVEPKVSPDGQQLAFMGYSSAGYDLHIMPYDPTSWTSVTFSKETIPSWPGFPKTDYPIHDYNPVPLLLPKYWVPILSEGRAGFSTSGTEALYRESYSLSGGYDWRAQAPFASFSLTSEQPFSPVVLSLDAGLEPDGNLQILGLRYSPYTSLFSSSTLGLQLRRTDFGGESHALSGSWIYSNRSGMDLIWDDLTLSLSATLSHIVKTNTFHQQLTLGVRDLIHLPLIDLAGTHQLALRAAVGWSDQAKRFAIGSESGLFMVRGQPRGLLRGSRAAAVSLEYRFPLMAIERGWGLYPIFLDKLRVNVFVDAATAGETLDASKLAAGYGAELQVLFTTGFTGQRNVRLGIAQGVGLEGPSFYFGFGSAF